MEVSGANVGMGKLTGRRASRWFWKRTVWVWSLHVSLSHPLGLDECDEEPLGALEWSLKGWEEPPTAERASQASRHMGPLNLGAGHPAR